MDSALPWATSGSKQCYGCSSSTTPARARFTRWCVSWTSSTSPRADLPAIPALDPLVLSFQLKLLWLAGYLPHLAGCAACGEEAGLVGFSPQAGGAVCSSCEAGAISLSAAGFEGIRGLLERPLADAPDAGLSARGRRETLRVIESSYEFHGGFRLRTLAGRA